MHYNNAGEITTTEKSQAFLLAYFLFIHRRTRTLTKAFGSCFEQMESYRSPGEEPVET